MAVVNDIDAQAPHLPVLLGPVLAALEPRDGGIYVDGTFGAGGYSRAILEAAQCSVIAIDRDPAARAAGDLLAAEFDGKGEHGEPDAIGNEPTSSSHSATHRGNHSAIHRVNHQDSGQGKSVGRISAFQLLEGCFSDMETLVAAKLGNGDAGLEEAQSGQEALRENAHGDFEFFLVDGVTLDVGVSSMQLDQSERGFSFMRDGPLDMRMSQSGLSAADVVNDFEPAQLRRIIKIYGEEKRAHAIAAAICRVREEKRFSTTRELAQLIEKVIGVPPGPRKAIHPATRTFQALRIFVNGELDELVRGLAAAERILKPGGRLAVVSFHSLEDRIVKKFLKRRTGSLPNPSRHAPMAPEGDAATFRELVRGGQTAGVDEIAENPRARSARLRSAVRTDAPAMALAETELAMGQIAGL